MNVPPLPQKRDTWCCFFQKKNSRPCRLTPWHWHNSHRSYRLSNVAPGIHRSNDPRIFTWRDFFIGRFFAKKFTTPKQKLANKNTWVLEYQNWELINIEWWYLWLEFGMYHASRNELELILGFQFAPKWFGGSWAKQFVWSSSTCSNEFVWKMFLLPTNGCVCSSQEKNTIQLKPPQMFPRVAPCNAPIRASCLAGLRHKKHDNEIFLKKCWKSQPNSKLDSLTTSFTRCLDSQIAGMFPTCGAFVGFRATCELHNFRPPRRRWMEVGRIGDPQGL